MDVTQIFAEGRVGVVGGPVPGGEAYAGGEVAVSVVW